MFDDQPNKPGTPPTNLPTEPEDMLAEVDDEAEPIFNKKNDALSNGLLKPKRISTDTPPVQTMPFTSSVNSSAPLSTPTQPVLGKLILFVLLAVVLGGAAFGAWWLYSWYTSNSKTSVEPANSVKTETKKVQKEEKKGLGEENSDSNTPVVIPTGTAEIPSATLPVQIQNDSILFGEPIDSDKDGLSDVREKELGTDPKLIDTDDDGLSDGDEMLIWKTNPLNQDADGDGFFDGDEIKNGYNPLGHGRLSISTSTATSSPARRK